MLINLANRLARNDDVANRQRLELVLKLLERAPAPGEAVIVKPTNFANRLVEPLLQLRPGARAILLWSDLETFLGSLVRRGMWGRRFGRQMYLQFAGWVPVNFGLGPAEMFELTDLQVAGLAWLLQIAHFSAVAKAAAPDRVLIVDAADLMAEPAKVLQGAQTLFGLGLDSGSVDKIASGPVFSTHSKFADQGIWRRRARARSSSGNQGPWRRNRLGRAVDRRGGRAARAAASAEAMNGRRAGPAAAGATGSASTNATPATMRYSRSRPSQRQS